MADWTPNSERWHEIDQMIQFRFAVYDSDTDRWLIIKRGITHGSSAIIERPLDELEQTIMVEVRGAVRAMQIRWHQEKHELPQAGCTWCDRDARLSEARASAED